MRRTILWHAVTGLVLSGLVTLSSGCRKELCYNHDEHAYSVKVDVTATWEREWERDHGRGWKNTWEGRGWNSWMTYDDLRPEVPGGIRAVVYDPDGNRHDERNLELAENLPPRTKRRVYFPHPPCLARPSIPQAEKQSAFGTGLPEGKKRNLNLYRHERNEQDRRNDGRGGNAPGQEIQIHVAGAAAIGLRVLPRFR